MGYPKKPVVLVVDDTIANIRILDDLLRGEYTVRVATNGATALRLALSEPRPDIVLLDIMMPDMDGYEVCRRLKSDPFPINIKNGIANQSVCDAVFAFCLYSALYALPIVQELEVEYFAWLRR